MFYNCADSAPVLMKRVFSLQVLFISDISLNTFGCIVLVAQEAVVNFPGVTLLLH